MVKLFVLIKYPPGSVLEKTVSSLSERNCNVCFFIAGVLIAFFAAGPNYVVLAIVAAVSAVIGYIVGKAMERDVVK